MCVVRRQHVAHKPSGTRDGELYGARVVGVEPSIIELCKRGHRVEDHQDRPERTCVHVCMACMLCHGVPCYAMVCHACTSTARIARSALANRRLHARLTARVPAVVVEGPMEPREITGDHGRAREGTGDPGGHGADWGTNGRSQRRSSADFVVTCMPN